MRLASFGHIYGDTTVTRHGVRRSEKGTGRRRMAAVENAPSKTRSFFIWELCHQSGRTPYGAPAPCWETEAQWLGPPESSQPDFAENALKTSRQQNSLEPKCLRALADRISIETLTTIVMTIPKHETCRRCTSFKARKVSLGRRSP
jgi:hypothetical protein